MIADAVQAGTDRLGSRRIAVRALSTESFDRNWLLTGARRRSAGGNTARIQRLEPAVALLVADRGHDEQIARAGRGDVGDADALGFLARQLRRRLTREVVGGAAGEANRAQPLTRVRDSGSAFAGLQLRGHVAEDHDRELEALGLVHGHQADAVAPLFENRRLLHLPLVGLRVQLLEEPAK